MAFLLGGAIFVVDTALVATHLASGTQPGAFGQAFVGASWTAAFIGLLGCYPRLADRSRWLIRAGAVFAVIGGLTMAIMAAASIGYSSGILNGSLADLVMYFLPGVFIGVVFGFGSFGIASLRTNIYTRSIGLLFLLLPLTFLFNLGTGIANVGGMAKILAVVAILSVTMLTIGYQIQSGKGLVNSEKSGVSSDATAR